MTEKFKKIAIHHDVWKDNGTDMTDDDLGELWDHLIDFCESQGWSTAGTAGIEEMVTTTTRFASAPTAAALLRRSTSGLATTGAGRARAAGKYLSSASAIRSVLIATGTATVSASCRRPPTKVGDDD